jgi:carboxymethylenebutenolidase
VSDNDKTLTEWVQIPVGGTAMMNAYLARPRERGPWPGVLVGFEMFGVTGYLRQVAADVASRGYLAVVPDFYHWQSADGSPVELTADADGRARGLELVNGLRRDQVEADVMAAIGYLRARPDCTGHAAMVGLSAGAHIAFWAATRIPLEALVAFYPGWLTSAEVGLSRPDPLLSSSRSIAALGTPVLILAGADDQLYAPGDLDAIGARLDRDGVVHELIVYPHTPHGFACFERDTYRPEAAADAWKRAFALLAEKFGTRNNPAVHRAVPDVTVNVVRTRDAKLRRP